MKKSRTYPFSNPAGFQDAVNVVTNDNYVYDRTPDALWVGVGGDVAVELDSGFVAFKNVPAGILPICPRKIFATGTDADAILALYYK